VIAAIDVGLKRIGVALSLDGEVAMPQPAILRKNREQAAKEVSEFLKAWKVETLVVGLPTEGSDAEAMARRIGHFVSLLDFGGEVVTMAEDFSSFEAKERMRGAIRQKRDGRIDSIAAQIILERYLWKRRTTA
jgi:putative Holliday junction resolvase